VTWCTLGWPLRGTPRSCGSKGADFSRWRFAVPASPAPSPTPGTQAAPAP
jgi:hypothetical protein